MPASFRTPTYTSFGHLTHGFSPLAAWTPSATATPAAIVTSGSASRDGRRMAETYKPAPGGDAQLRPNRPRPDDCAFAATTHPSGAPSSASDAAASLVEPTSSYQTIRCWNGPSRSPVLASASAMSPGRTPGLALGSWELLQRFNFETQINGGGRVRQRTNGDEIGTRRSQFAHPLQRDAARDFRFRAATAALDRFEDLVGRQVIE